MIKENEWNNDFHEDLFKLFILESNGVRFVGEDGHKFIDEHCNGFTFQWEDRAVREEEFEGWVSARCVADYKKEDGVWGLRKKKFKSWNKKIKFRFVENEND